MGTFSGLKTDDTVKDGGDRLGGFQPLDSGLYQMTIEMAYTDLSMGGARGVHLELKDAGGNQLKHTLWVTSGDAKGNKPTYTDRDGNEQFLPGMNVANALCELTCEKELHEMDTEEKVIQVYDFNQKMNANVKKDVIMDLLKKRISVGIIKEVVDKNQKDDAGNWVPTGETRTQNEIDKLFNADTNLTLAETKAGVTEPGFINKWSQKNKGVTRQKAKGATKSSPGLPPASSAAASATPSLFED